jgi:hypothetical protein
VYHFIGLGVMPPAVALAGVPLIGQETAPLPVGVAWGGATPIPPTSVSAAMGDGAVPALTAAVPIPTAAMQAHYTAMGPAITPPVVPSGVYVGEGIAPVPKKVADKIVKGEYVRAAPRVLGQPQGGRAAYGRPGPSLTVLQHGRSALRPILASLVLKDQQWSLSLWRTLVILFG